jgi:hypothetical protein
MWVRCFDFIFWRVAFTVPSEKDELHFFFLLERGGLDY